MRNERGVTLMEIMVSVIVLSIAIIFLYHMLFGGRMLVEMEGERRMALKLAEHKVEELKQAGYNWMDGDEDWTARDMAVGSHPKDGGTLLIDDRGTPDAGDDLMGTLTWSVRDTTFSDFGIDADCKIVRVTVTWPLSTSRESLSVVSIVGS